MSMLTTMRLAFFALLVTATAACGDFWEPKPTADVTVRVPKQGASLSPQANAAQQEWVRVSVRGEGMQTLQVTALAGERISLEVPSGKGRVFSAEIFSDAALTVKTYGGESPPTDLTPGSAVTVVIEVRRTVPEVKNTPPTLTAAVIQAGDYYKTSAIQVKPEGWSDPDGDLPQYKFIWLVNDAEVQGAAGDTLTGEHFKKGDRVACRVTPIDAESEGPPVVSNEVTILNSAPVITLALPGGPFYTGSVITPIYSVTDADNDSLQIVTEWFVEGEPYTTEEAKLPPYSAAKGQQVVFSVTASDGTIEVSSQTEPAVIANSPPHINYIALDTTAPRKASSVTVSVEYDDVDGDIVSISYQWYVNGTPVVDATTDTITGDYFNRGDEIKVLISLTDTFDLTDEFSETAVAVNTPPQVDTVYLSEGPHKTNSTISVETLGWSDDDGDEPFYVYTWLVNGTPVGGQEEGYLNGAYFDKNDFVAAVVTPFDGYDYGAAITTEAAMIQNSPPQLYSLFWTSMPLFTDTNATYYLEAYDEDGDSITIESVWQVNGSPVGGLNDDSYLPSTFFERGDTVQIDIQLFDGEEYGDQSYLAAVVDNSPPSAPEVSIVPLYGALLPEGENGEAEIVVHVDGFDPDGDSVSYEVSWYVNGVYYVTNAGNFWANAVPGGLVGGDVVWAQVEAKDDFGGISEPVYTNSLVVASSVKKVSVGYSSTCAISGSDSLWCWGAGPTGQQVFLSPTIPVAVPQFANDASDVSVGDFHACAVKKDGSLYCWGSNFYGQLGTGGNDNSVEPVVVPGMQSVVQVAAGNEYTCARTYAGALYCWGHNFHGKLGIGSAESQFNAPQLVTFGEPVSWVSAGTNLTCGVGISGTGKCWGLSNYGQVGNGAYESKYVPTEIGLSNLLKIEAGDRHACALRTDGAVACWGYGSDGAIGNLTGFSSNVPQWIDGLWASVVDLDAGYEHSCVVYDGGYVDCFGSNVSGSLGNGSATKVLGLQEVWLPPTFSPVVAVSTGSNATCAVTYGGGLLCWGQNNGGKLGNGGTFDRMPPTVAPVYPVMQVAAGYKHVCALTDSDMYCWGYSSWGQHGTGDYAQAHWEPVFTEFGPGLPVKVDAFGYNTCALQSDGSLWCAGNNFNGQTGNGTIDGLHVYSPIQAIGLEDGVVDFSVAGEFACAVTTGLGLRCWGRNDVGQLGLGYSGDPVTVPSLVPVPEPVYQVAGGVNHACAIGVSGDVWCWGNNQYGKLGIGSDSSREVPTHVDGLSNATKVVAGMDGTCALTSSGEVYCWGEDITSGQPGYTPMHTTPQRVGSFTGVLDIAMTWQHACLISAEGEVYCWGANSGGQLAVADAIADTPVGPVPLPYPATQLALGDAFSCALNQFADLWCWGKNEHGAIGDYTTWEPRPVVGFISDEIEGQYGD